jgi:hypothetical protein
MDMSVWEAPLLVVKRMGREPDHVPPSSAEVKKMWNYTSTSPLTFMSLYLIKRRDYFARTQ